MAYESIVLCKCSGKYIDIYFSLKITFPPHPDLVVGSTSLNSCDFLKILGVTFDSKFTFKRHIRSISSSVAQKIGLLRKSFRIFGIMMFY